MTSSPSRRRFLKVGLFGALTLAVAGGAWRALHGAPKLSPYQPDDAARAAFRAIAASLLKGAIPDSDTAAADRAVDAALQAIHGLPLSAQKEVADLFALLTLAPSRRLLAGVPDDWREAKPADVEAFLTSWRYHRMDMLQAAYAALHDLILGPWYAQPANWEAIGYPGPMKGF